MGTILAPFLIAAIYIFGEETKIPSMYNIRQNDLICYLLFGLLIVPFQVLMDIFMNHAVEVGFGVRIYDYMLYSQWRWRNRLTRWLFDDPRMDQSIAEPLQSVNHLCFSPQFYFIETYYSWGILMLLLAVTTLLRWGVNPFDDPALMFFILQQVLCNQVVDRFIRFLTQTVLWKPKGNAVFRAFSNSAAFRMRRKAQAINQEKWRNWLMDKHLGWFVKNLGEVFTPRSRKQYRDKLSQLYQQALHLQPARIYRTPKPPMPPTAKEELPMMLRDELADEDSSDSDPGVDMLMGHGVSGVTVRAPQRQLGDGSPPPSPGALPALPGPGGPMPAGMSLPELTLPVQPGAPSPTSALRLPAAPAFPAAPPPAPGQQPALPPMPTDGGTLAIAGARPLPPEPSRAILPPPPWPLAMPEGEEAIPGAPGPLAGLVGAAWLRTARRRVQMIALAHQWKKEMEPEDRCEECGVQEDDPYASEGLGDWGNEGPELGVEETLDIHQLIRGFEVHHGVPPVPFEDDQWWSWLDRSDHWKTLCVRCACKGGFRQPRSAAAAALQDSPKEQRSPKKQKRSDMSDSGSDKSDGLGGASLDSFESEPEEDKFPEWADTEVSMAGKEMMIYWIKLARKRCKDRRANAIILPPDPVAQGGTLPALPSLQEGGRGSTPPHASL
eukprot:gnl/TRDRNA2_/TRDRNA2_139886_c4_seq1.p1 gnl/TRDRNA2_/TRDRNA2_139886_c4~~gnl/TRDRNA2_/TRDRNA2_139886_c4_seq1.p1  ORF type:complete len:738 (-),score=160.48 gnl/TRDRNA2_/TRDRNA2_139886_c4_seq1:91-2085(-)